MLTHQSKEFLSSIYNNSKFTQLFDFVYSIKCLPTKVKNF